MSIIRCDQCDRHVDTDHDEVERFACGEDDSFSVCPACAEKIFAEQEADMLAAKREYDITPLSERDPERYRREMIEAGRGHLLPPE